MRTPQKGRGKSPAGGGNAPTQAKSRAVEQPKDAAKKQRAEPTVTQPQALAPAVAPVVPQSVAPKPAQDDRPLYLQFYDVLFGKIQSGEWQPGQLIPNEFDIAALLNTSQGTARKALSMMADDGLLERRQGKGSFVAQYTPQNAHLFFMNFHDAQGRRVGLESDPARAYPGSATDEEAAHLGIARNAPILRIKRVRRRQAKPFLHETVVLPASLFPNLTMMDRLPNTLFDLYQNQFKIVIIRSDEKLTTSVCPPEIAAQLALQQGTVVFKVSRVGYDATGRAIEWRTSYVDLGDCHYLSKQTRA
ncbi:MAG: hypothetical protein RL291_2012 [Pseudomonadota bacterium]